MKRYIFFLLLLFPFVGIGQKPFNSPHYTTGILDTVYLFKSGDKVWKLHVTSDSTLYFNGKHYSLKAHGGGGSTDTTSHIKSWKYEVTSNSQNNFSVSFPLIATSVIIYNSTPLENSQWSGIGTSTLSVAVPTKQYDKLTIIK